jgi:hypothetical protein
MVLLLSSIFQQLQLAVNPHDLSTASRLCCQNLVHASRSALSTVRVSFLHPSSFLLHLLTHCCESTGLIGRSSWSR